MMQSKPRSVALTRGAPNLLGRTPNQRASVGASVGSKANSRLHSPGWLFAFVGLEISCQCLLLFQEIAGARVFVRSAAFGVSIALALLLRGSGDQHPAKPMALFALAIVALGIFHPLTSSLAAGFATLCLTLAIVGPIFWVPNIRISPSNVRSLFLMLWAFDTASAVFGALQVYYPGSFMPAISSTITDEGGGILQITLANGAQVARPMGLTDTPGGAAAGGTFCMIFALTLLLDRPSLLIRPFLIGSMALGCFVLYLCQVRSMLIMMLLACAAMLVAALKGGSMRPFRGAFWAAGAAIGGFVMAVIVGGSSVTDRLGTLIEDDPGAVFYSNRGFFLEYTFTDLLPDYPLGAGLGRWGMMRNYFKDPSNVASTMIWSEIQWQAWVIDGGAPLALAMLVALGLTVREVFRIATRSDIVGSELHMTSVAVVGYSVGLVAMTFNANCFSTTFGLDFWLLNAVIFAASRQQLAGMATNGPQLAGVAAT
jgi:hypothetical protein